MAVRILLCCGHLWWCGTGHMQGMVCFQKANFLVLVQLPGQGTKPKARSVICLGSFRMESSSAQGSPARDLDSGLSGLSTDDDTTQWRSISVNQFDPSEPEQWTLGWGLSSGPWTPQMMRARSASMHQPCIRSHAPKRLSVHFQTEPVVSAAPSVPLGGASSSHARLYGSTPNLQLAVSQTQANALTGSSETNMGRATSMPTLAESAHRLQEVTFLRLHRSEVAALLQSAGLFFSQRHAKCDRTQAGHEWAVHRCRPARSQQRRPAAGGPGCGAGCRHQEPLPAGRTICHCWEPQTRPSAWLLHHLRPSRGAGLRHQGSGHTQP